MFGLPLWDSYTYHRGATFNFAPMPDHSTPDSFEAVYYSYAVPRTTDALTLLGLVFDRIHFPAVYMPPPGFDQMEVISEIQRIAALKRKDTQQMLACMGYALHHEHLSDFCIFSGDAGGSSDLDPDSHAVVDRLEEMVFGPRAEGEIPVRTGRWIKGFSLHERSLEYQVRAPDTITYPANALVYSAKHGLPLINDAEWLPVPGLPDSPKSNAKLLGTILAIESVKLVLPNIKPLQPIALKEFREEIAGDAKPFRLAMLKLAAELNRAISAGSSYAEIQKEARFLVETTVYPQLAELKAVVNNPKKHWYRRAAELAKSSPELASNFFTLPTSVAIAKTLAKVAGLLSDIRDEQLEAQQQLARSGLNYLLRLNRLAKE